MIEADIQIMAGDWRSLMDDPAAVAQQVMAATGTSPACHSGGEIASGGGYEVCIALSDDAHVQALNRDYRGRDRPTNVLAFPARGPAGAGGAAGAARFLGDVVLAFETLRREAKAQKKPFAHHMSHLIVHGTLHLLGYDHQSDQDAARMEAEEAAILARLGIPDPYVTKAVEEAGTPPNG